MKILNVFEHGTLRIGENNFQKMHWEACVKFNEAHANSYFDVLHNGLRFKHFVGALQIDGLLIQIHPKSDKSDSDEKWRNILIPMLRACGHLKAQTHDNAFLEKQHFNLLELYFEFYLSEVERLIQQGFIKRYRQNTSNVKVLKGKIDFAGNIRHNLIHKERFYTTHQVYDTNHVLHRVLHHALEIVNHFSKGTRLHDYSGRIRLAFPDVDTIIPSTELLEKIKLDRKTEPYKRALQLAKLIILKYSPDIDQGRHKMISLLFDMNQLWEEYIYTMLRKNEQFRENGWEIYGQQSKLFYGTNRYIRPDIVLKNNNNVFVIDTKWKIPYGNFASIEDLRQMYVYGRYWKAPKLLLLYPGKADNSNFRSYSNSHGDDISHECKIGKVSVVVNNRLNQHIAEDILNLFES